MALEAKIILDSISPLGYRLTTMEWNFHRWLLPEVNTHRSQSKNSASSRAIPVEKQLLKLLNDPAFPVVWGSEQKGMQSGPELTGAALEEAQQLFADVYAFILERVTDYIDSHPLDVEGSTRLHKSLVNRLLEPFMWHRVIMTGTEAGWENLFSLRSSYFTKLAQPEFMIVADLAYDAMQNSTPTLVQYGEWATPYILPDDDFSNGESPLSVSVARCARVSYMTHENIRDLAEDQAMYERLISAVPRHDSPMEHVATPALPGDKVLGNFEGWHQLRHWGK